MVDFLPAMAGAVVGGAMAMTVQIAKSRLDIYAARYDDLCKIMLQAAELSSEYWLLCASSEDIPDMGDAQKKENDRARILEVRIQGLQEQILLGDEDLRAELPSATRDQVKDLLPKFIDSMTGGEFSARTGSRVPASASAVQVEAAQLISAIRSGIRKKYTFRHLIKRALRRH
jgi:hypothetical protein